MAARRVARLQGDIYRYIYTHTQEEVALAIIEYIYSACTPRERASELERKKRRRCSGKSAGDIREISISPALFAEMYRALYIEFLERARDSISSLLHTI